MCWVRVDKWWILHVLLFHGTPSVDDIEGQATNDKRQTIPLNDSNGGHFMIPSIPHCPLEFCSIHRDDLPI